MKTHDALARQDAGSAKDKAVDLVPAELAGTPQVDDADARVIDSHVGVCTAECEGRQEDPKWDKDRAEYDTARADERRQCDGSKRREPRHYLD